MIRAAIITLALATSTAPIDVSNNPTITRDVAMAGQYWHAMRPNEIPQAHGSH